MHMMWRHRKVIDYVIQIRAPLIDTRSMRGYLRRGVPAQSRRKPLPLATVYQICQCSICIYEECVDPTSQAMVPGRIFKEVEYAEHKQGIANARALYDNASVPSDTESENGGEHSGVEATSPERRKDRRSSRRGRDNLLSRANEGLSAKLQECRDRLKEWPDDLALFSDQDVVFITPPQSTSPDLNPGVPYDDPCLALDPNQSAGLYEFERHLCIYRDIAEREGLANTSSKDRLLAKTILGDVEMALQSVGALKRTRWMNQRLDNFVRTCKFCLRGITSCSNSAQTNIAGRGDLWNQFRFSVIWSLVPCIYWPTSQNCNRTSPCRASNFFSVKRLRHPLNLRKSKMTFCPPYLQIYAKRPDYWGPNHRSKHLCAAQSAIKRTIWKTPTVIQNFAISERFQEIHPVIGAFALLVRAV